MNRLRPFELARPASPAAAAALLLEADGEARFLAGGTDLLVDMKLGRARPRLLVDLNGIPGLGGIERAGGALRLGALATAEAVAASGLVRNGWRALAQAAGVLGPPGVRHLATVGGNLGRASPASDLAPPLLVLGGRARVAGPSGEREVPVEDLAAGPGVTRLAPGELITEVLVPGPAPRSGSAHLKLGRRGAGWDLAVAGVAAMVALAEDGKVQLARVALSSVAPTVRLAGGAEAALLGRRPAAAVLDEAAAAAADEALPISDVRATAAYRQAVVRVLARRALGAACSAAGVAREALT